MEACGIVPKAVEAKIHEPEKHRIDDRGESWIEAASEGLLNDAAEEYLLANGVEENCGQRIKCKQSQRRHQAPHRFQVKIVSNTDAPVVRRISIDLHPEA